MTFPNNSRNVDLVLLKQMILAGTTRSEAARHFDCSISTVDYQAKKLKLRFAKAKRGFSVARANLTDEEICAEFYKGSVARAAGEKLGTSRNIIIAVWTKYGLTQKPKLAVVPRRQLPPVVEPLPPSLAMIRLAQHDPVIMRALRQRRGEVIEDVPDLRYHKQEPLIQKRGRS